MGSTAMPDARHNRMAYTATGSDNITGRASPATGPHNIKDRALQPTSG